MREQINSTQARRFAESAKQSADAGAGVGVFCPNPRCGKPHRAALADLNAGKIRCGCGSIMDADDTVQPVLLPADDAMPDDAASLASLQVAGGDIPEGSGDAAGLAALQNASGDDRDDTAPADRPQVKCPSCQKTFRLTDSRYLPVRCVSCGATWSTHNMLGRRRYECSLARVFGGAPIY